MKITRNFGDTFIEIELTRQEMSLAHHIVELEANIGAIECTYSGVFSQDELEEIAEEMNDLVCYGGATPDNVLERALFHLGYDDRVEDLDL